MLRRIVVPIDGSPFGEQAIPVAMQIARSRHAMVELVHVHDMFAVASTLGMAGVGTPATAPLLIPTAEVEREARKASEAYVRMMERHVAVGSSVAASATMLEGKVAETLARHANTVADLVVMTTHGRGGLTRLWLGSVAEGVVREATVPILLLKPGEAPNGVAVGRDGRFREVLVPLDGSPVAEHVLEPVIEIAGGDNAGVTCTLLLVQQPITAMALSSLAATVPPDARLNTHDEPTVAYLDCVAERLRSRGIRIRTRAVVHTSPARAIIDQAHESDVDLIAMTTHGRGGIRRLFIGSVADKVLRGTDRPVLLYRTPET